MASAGYAGSLECSLGNAPFTLFARESCSFRGKGVLIELLVGMGHRMCSAPFSRLVILVEV
jgi:hypothetical protein